MSKAQSTKRVAPGRRVERICPVCQNPFMALCIEINRGAGIFCSKACYHRSRSRPLEERFWERVNKDGPPPAHRPELGPCWLWTGARHDFGYGMIHDPASARSQGLESTHRASWRLHFGPIPAGACVLHQCDNPPCVRPDHLFLGTLKDNTQDMLQKDRHGAPGRPKGSKLSPESLASFRQKRGWT